MPLRPLSFAAVAGLYFSLLTVACQPDTGIQANALLGRWELQKALRNQKETGNLDGTFFAFREDGKMTTNLTGSEITTDYGLQKNEIIQKGAQATNYQIKSFTDSTLVLVTTMRGIEFQVELVRAPEPAPQEESTTPDSILILEMDTLAGER